MVPIVLRLVRLFTLSFDGSIHFPGTDLETCRLKSREHKFFMRVTGND